MREIKFRAWSKREKYMYKWKQIHDGNLDDMIADKNIILMQYTGLKDKDGKGIYEGDILQCKSIKVEVIWNVDAWRMREEGGEISLSPIDMVVIEAIGNIYENPELLEKK